MTKGFRGEANSSYRRAKEALLKADQYRYRDRRNRKRDFRRLWITRINAAARQHDLSYSSSCTAFSLAGVEVDRKILADIAVRDAEAFRRFAEPPARRWLRRLAEPPTHLPIGRRFLKDGALSVKDRRDMTITSPHNDRLKELRKLAQRRVRSRRAGSWPRARICSTRRTRPAGRPWSATARRTAGWRGEVEPHLLAHVSQLGSGTRALGVFEQRWAPAPAGPLCVALHGHRGPRQRRDGAALGAGLRRGHRSRSAGTARTRSGRRRCGRRWARSSRCRSRGSTAVDELPGTASRSTRTGARRCAGRGAR